MKLPLTHKVNHVNIQHPLRFQLDLMPKENIHLFRFLEFQLLLRFMGSRQRFDENVVSFLDIDVVVIHDVSDRALFLSNIQ